VIVVENSSSAGTASFTDLTLLSNDIPAAAASCDDALRLHIDDDDDDDDTLGQSLIVHHHTRLVRGLDVKTNATVYTTAIWKPHIGEIHDTFLPLSLLFSCSFDLSLTPVLILHDTVIGFIFFCC